MLQSRLRLCAAAAAAGGRGSGFAAETSSQGTSPSSSSSSADPVEPAGVGFRSHGGDTPQAQREALRLLIRGHEAAVQRNSARRDTVSSTYEADSCSAFPFYQLVSLPPTVGGDHRAGVRAALTEAGGPLEGLAEALLAPWQRAAGRRVAVFGCKSVPYLQRQLAADEEHSLLVVDHSLKALANAAAALTKDFGPRVHFLRADAMFAALSVLSPDSVDTIVAPMPAPFWSEKGSYRRLVTSDFLCAAHRVLKERAGAADPRGLIAFTDCEPYADFMVEQLTEAKLIVPWTRKNPQEAYGRWLPAGSETGAGVDSGAATSREFPQQLYTGNVAVAASKSGPTSEQALSFIEGHSYKRKYFRAFNDGSH